MVARVSAVAVRSAVVLRGRHRAVDGVSLEARAGEWVSFIGRNGAGKSTLLLAIAGLIRLHSGDVSCAGPIGLVLQRTSLDPLLTVAENALLFARLHGVPGDRAASRLAELLDDGDLNDRRNDQIRTLSGGLARRADLVRACIVSPDLLILDEPTAGLDQPSREAFLGLVRRVRGERQTTVLWATHDDAEARAADRVIVLDGGTIIADGSPTDLGHDDDHRVVRIGDGEPELLQADAALDRVRSAVDGGLAVAVAEPTLLDRCGSFASGKP